MVQDTSNIGDWMSRIKFSEFESESQFMLYGWRMSLTYSLVLPRRFLAWKSAGKSIPFVYKTAATTRRGMLGLLDLYNKFSLGQIVYYM